MKKLLTTLFLLIPSFAFAGQTPPPGSSGQLIANVSNQWGAVTVGTGLSLSGGALVTANLTGPITSVGNSTSIASQTGTGSVFVMSSGPTINVPIFSGAITASAVRTTTTSPVTISASSDYIVCVNTTSGATTVNLPSSPTTGLQFVVKDCKGNASSSNITITPSSGNIDGSATLVLNTNYQSVSVFWNGTQWYAF